MAQVFKLSRCYLLQGGSNRATYYTEQVAPGFEIGNRHDAAVRPRIPQPFVEDFACRIEATGDFGCFINLALKNEGSVVFQRCRARLLKQVGCGRGHVETAAVLNHEREPETFVWAADKNAVADELQRFEYVLHARGVFHANDVFKVCQPANHLWGEGDRK